MRRLNFWKTCFIYHFDLDLDLDMLLGFSVAEAPNSGNRFCIDLAARRWVGGWEGRSACQDFWVREFVQELEIRLSTGREGEDWGGGGAASSLPLLLLLLVPLLHLLLLLLSLRCSRAAPLEAAPGKNQAQTSLTCTTSIHTNQDWQGWRMG